MKIEHVEKTEAVVVVTARLTEGEFSVKVSASCEYAPVDLKGATVSAEITVEGKEAAAVKKALDAVFASTQEELGRRLARAKTDAYRTSVEQGEIKL